MPCILTIQIDADSVSVLKNAGYNLCISRLVNGKYNVVWRSTKDFLMSNKIKINDKFQVYGVTGTDFKSGPVPAPTTDLLNILGGQGVTLASSGEWGPVAGIPASGKSIRISNKYDSISFGVKVLEDKKYYDIFLSETSYSAGEVELSPKRSFLLWAEPNVEAGTVFTDAKMNAIEVKILPGMTEQTVRYIVDPNNVQMGAWFLGEIPALGSQYDPISNTFSVTDQNIPSPALIEKINNVNITEVESEDEGHHDD